ncbi:MAG: RDD family protein [Phycisphaerae bacterium]
MSDIEVAPPAPPPTVPPATPVSALTCAICERHVRKLRRAKNLMGFSVCVKCRNRYVGRRQFAYLIDVIAFNALTFVGGLLLALAGAQIPDPVLGLVAEILFSWILLPCLFFTKDGFSGMSPGKRIMGLQVVDATTREPIRFAQSFKRNLVLIIPLVGVLGAILTMYRGRRWGDGWANTVVVWRRYAHKAPFDPRGILCTKCGYNLTGNISGRCPECFHPIPPNAAPPPPEAAPVA